MQKATSHKLGTCGTRDEKYVPVNLQLASIFFYGEKK
jgi:hypothetical protein